MKSLSPASRYKTLTLHPPAKINWFLSIIGKRQDGYHDIVTVMQCVSLYDVLHIEHADTIEIICDYDIEKENNIVYKAASLFKIYTKYPRGARITLKKNIPVCAGLGGGSSDAAYTLSGLNSLWETGVSNSELKNLCLQIGSDVPFFLNGPCALVEGKGDKVKAFQIDGPHILLLVKPDLEISTAWAYESFEKFHHRKLTKNTIDIKLFCRSLKLQDFTSLNSVIYNDLEKTVQKSYPVLKEIKESMVKMGALISAMSGSGPTVFGVFESKEKAKKAAMAMNANWVMVVETLVSNSYKNLLSA